MYREITIQSNSVPIVLSIWQSDIGNPSIVFLPGTMSHPLMYQEFLEGLSNIGFHVIGLHYLSHGKSPKIKMNYTMEDLLCNVYDATTYGIETFGDNIAVMGSSQGGILAAMTAGRDTRLKAVFPHNIMLTTLKETMSLTKYPIWTHRFMGLIQWGFRIGGRLFPNHKVPADAYLDFDRVFHSEQAKNDCLNDPLLLPDYPLKFVASLFNADLACLENGSIRCPVVLITAKGDPLFSFDYTKKVFERINAPQKELVVLNLSRHMIFHEGTADTIKELEHALQKYLRSVIDNSGAT